MIVSLRLRSTFASMRGSEVKDDAKKTTENISAIVAAAAGATAAVAMVAM